MSNSAQALPLVVLQDSYTNTIPSAPGAGVNAPNTFTSVAAVAGTTTYTVNTGGLLLLLGQVSIFGEGKPLAAVFLPF